MREIWKDVVGFEGRYKVSDQGRVRSVTCRVRLVTRGTRKEITRLSPGKLLSPGLMDRFGHVSVAIGKGNSQGVHVLVAAAFIGPRPPKHDVAHLNGVGGDNRAANLGYVTRSENNRHMVLHGKRDLTAEDVRAIRSRLSEVAKRGDKKKIADDFGITGSVVWGIEVGRNYSHVR